MPLAKMNGIYLICLLAFCTAQAMITQGDCAIFPKSGRVSSLKHQLDVAKSTIDNIILDLSRTAKEYEMATTSKISNNRDENIRTLNNFTDIALSQIRTAVDAAKAGGKNAGHCYTTIELSLKILSKFAIPHLNKCEQKSIEIIDSQMGRFRSAETSGEAIHTKLNDVLSNCMSRNDIQLPTCLSTTLRIAHQTIESWSNSVSSLKEKVSCAAKNAFGAIMRCGMKFSAHARVGILNARLAASQCIASA